MAILIVIIKAIISIMIRLSVALAVGEEVATATEALAMELGRRGSS